MKHRYALAVALAVAIAVFSGVAIDAITNGVPDGENHPYVAFLLFYAPDADGNDVPQWWCTGSLISETVVLTAGHCTNIGPGAGDATKAEVWFDADVIAAGFPDGGIPSAGLYTHPDFTWDGAATLKWDAVDDGIVILSQPVTDRPFAALPPVGLADILQPKTPVDLVGYGVQDKLQVSGPPASRWTLDFLRYWARSEVITSRNLGSESWLKVTANPGQDKGGTCFGDSGGPALLAGTNVILATTSFSQNMNCAGVGYMNRVDRAVVLDWVRTFLE